MMNLELLFEATNVTGDSTYYDIAITHANTTLKNHFRNNNSSYHVVNYDTITGNVISKNTAHDYADESAWARGQSWGLYGHTICYRETNEIKYLNRAKKIADFILTNNNLPKDKVPYWDYDIQNIPNSSRDASAAAIICSALNELSSFLNKNGNKYKKAADDILRSLSSSNYLAKQGEICNFILKHSVGNMPQNRK